LLNNNARLICFSGINGKVYNRRDCTQHELPP
jgi:hypothetical protein